MQIVSGLFCQQVKSLLPLILWMLTASTSCQTLKQDSAMPVSTIQFIPETFNDLELGFLSSDFNPCSPMYPESAISQLRNELRINAPKRIIYNLKKSGDTVRPVIPVCLASVITLRRTYKYPNLSEEVLFIRRTDSDSWFSGKVFDETLEDGTPIVQPPWQQEMEEEKQKRIEEAQSYSEEELDEGQAGGEYRNLNLMQYVDMPFKPGVYEIYYTLKGLESNRVQVEIVFEE